MSQLSDMIKQKIVDPALQTRFYDTYGVVSEYDDITRTASIIAHNPYTSQDVTLIGVSIDSFDPDSHLTSDPKIGDYIKVGFFGGQLSRPFIRKVLSKEEIREETASVIPGIMGAI